MNPSLFIRGQWGLGDNIFARPFIKELAKTRQLYIDTPWPEIYQDLPVKFARFPRELRTQMKNMRRQRPDRWSTVPGGIESRRISYSDIGLAPGCSLPALLQSRFRAVPDWPAWDLPTFGNCLTLRDTRPIAVIKATTVRLEWEHASRNPLPEYVNAIAAQLMATHQVFAVADLAGADEKLVGEAPPAHVHFLHGELSVDSLIELVRMADVIVGGVGWNIPMSIALRVKSFCVLGGRGGHNAPEILTSPAMDLSRIAFAMPAKFCRCSTAKHDCDKTIPDLAAQWSAFWDRASRSATAA
jgi:hypothetical protein